MGRGPWASLVGCEPWELVVPGSNPGGPTNYIIMSLRPSDSFSNGIKSLELPAFWGRLAWPLPAYSPLNSGLRLDMKASMPSRMSLVVKTTPKQLASSL